MAWLMPLKSLFHPQPAQPRASNHDAVGENLRAAVREHTRVKADSCRTYETRVQGMINELFLRMGEGHARHDP